MKVEFFNRATGTVEEEAIFGEGPLRWVYETHLGKITLWALVRRSIFSKIYGWEMSRPSSRERILPFIEKYGIDAETFETAPENFKSFNDFFSRKLKANARPVAAGNAVACLPADGRHFAFENLSATTQIFAKGQQFDLKTFLGDETLAKRYEQGSLLCSRLCPTDYHRFHLPVAGTLISEPRLINGMLYSVNPIALSQNLAYLWENKRIVVEIDSPEFGKVTQVIVGATNVGTICLTAKPGMPLAKGEELGYFRFGGSFVATFFEKGRIRFCDDLTGATKRGLETYALMGEILGSGQ
ncbi:MAG: archaetidylserine decarboxylase [Opitutales bacterium]|nr:archaetidylserine decarboxylase [Opitutales bacterium]